MPKIYTIYTCPERIDQTQSKLFLHQSNGLRNEHKVHESGSEFSNPVSNVNCGVLPWFPSPNDVFKMSISMSARFFRAKPFGAWLTSQSLRALAKAVRKAGAALWLSNQHFTFLLGGLEVGRHFYVVLYQPSYLIDFVGDLVLLINNQEPCNEIRGLHPLFRADVRQPLA